MKTRHAAALALVGWYLMLPPVREAGPPDLGAPLGKWGMLSPSFDSAKECEAYKLKLAEKVVKERRPDYIRADAKCVASDDPRLKGN